MTTFRIRNWSKHFENNRTRELKELRFVLLPNKHDGDGYTELLDHPNGAAHYGAWCALVQVASKGLHPADDCENPAVCCECRGNLLRDGGKAHDAASLSRLTRIPIIVFEELLPRLFSIGWIERIPEQTQQPPVDSASQQKSATSPTKSRTPLRKSDTEWNGREANRKGGRSTAAPPRKRGKPQANETPPPDLFPVTDDLRAWAAEKAPGIDPDFETERFLDKARAKGWTAVDWIATWRTWMRNAKKFADEDAKMNGSAPPARVLTIKEKMEAGIQ